MTEATDHLLSLAEIAVAFAGFSALMTALSTRSTKSAHQADSFRMRVLVETALLVAFFSILPVVLAKFSLEASTVWRTSAATFIAVGLLGTVINLKRFRTIGVGSRLSDRLASALGWAVDVLQYVFLLLVVIGFTPARFEALYFAALYANLAMAGLMFTLFTASFLADARE